MNKKTIVRYIALFPLPIGVDIYLIQNQENPYEKGAKLKEGNSLKKSILLLSHSKKVTDGIKEMIEQMQQTDDVEVLSLGGIEDGELGSDPMKIVDAVNQSADSSAYFVFADLGSAVMNSELAKDLLEEAQQKNYYLVDAPLVEGAFAAAITAGTTDNIEQIIEEAQQAGKKGWL